MLLLLFQFKENLYAIDASTIVEIVPIVALNKIHQADPAIAGYFNYRGTVVPVIDMGQLLQGEASRRLISTRLLIVDYLTENGESQRLALMAERVTGTFNHSELKQSHNQADSQMLIQTAEGLVQFIDWKRLVASISIPSLLMV